MPTTEPDEETPDVAGEPANGEAVEPVNGDPSAAEAAESKPTAGEAVAARHSFAEEAAPEAPRTVLARLYEEEQRIDGRTRWSIGESRHRCAECQSELPADVPFDTVLCEAELDSAPTPANAPECSALFERRDFCPRCFAALALDRTFAHWKSVVAPSGEPPRKVFNLASLLAYFERLVGAERIHAAREADDSEAAGEDPDEPERPRDTLSDEEQEVRAELAYLLGLFLVRKRLLRWGQRSAGELTLILRKSDPERSYHLTLPPETAVERARGWFEELFT